MLCWETIAEAMYEIRADGVHAKDAIQILREELLLISCPAVKKRIDIIMSNPSFGTHRDINDISSILSGIEDYNREIVKIITEKLLGRRK